MSTDFNQLQAIQPVLYHKPISPISPSCHILHKLYLNFLSFKDSFTFLASSCRNNASGMHLRFLGQHYLFSRCMYTFSRSMYFMYAIRCYTHKHTHTLLPHTKPISDKKPNLVVRGG